jgi:hypothetical protein
VKSSKAITALGLNISDSPISDRIEKRRTQIKSRTSAKPSTSTLQFSAPKRPIDNLPPQGSPKLDPLDIGSAGGSGVLAALGIQDTAPVSARLEKRRTQIKSRASSMEKQSPDSRTIKSQKSDELVVRTIQKPPDLTQQTERQRFNAPRSNAEGVISSQRTPSPRALLDAINTSGVNNDPMRTPPIDALKNRSPRDILQNRLNSSGGGGSGLDNSPLQSRTDKKSRSSSSKLSSLQSPSSSPQIGPAGSISSSNGSTAPIRNKQQQQDQDQDNNNVGLSVSVDEDREVTELSGDKDIVMAGSKLEEADDEEISSTRTPKRKVRGANGTDDNASGNEAVKALLISTPPNSGRSPLPPISGSRALAFTPSPASLTPPRQSSARGTISQRIKERSTPT